jgi:hypothetical protein
MEEEDVLSVYQRPYNPARPVVCVDEKSKTLHSHTKGREPLPMCPRVGDKPGHSERVDYEYKREGTANIFIATEPLAGKRRVRATEQRTGDKKPRTCSLELRQFRAQPRDNGLSTSQ